MDEEAKPTNWKKNYIFKKREQTCPRNCKRITLLISVRKLFRKMIHDRFSELVPTREEQEGARKNISESVFMCFIDLTKANAS